MKTHLSYSLAILLLVSLFIWVFQKHPRTITQTKTVTQVVTKTIVKTITIHDKITAKTKIERINKDGSRTITWQGFKETTQNSTVLRKKLDEKSTETDKIVQPNLNRFTAQVMYNTKIYDVSNYTNLSKYTAVAGVRVFSSPVLINVGVNGTFNTYTTGITLELP